MAAANAPLGNNLGVPIGYFYGFGGTGADASKTEVTLVLIGEHELSHTIGVRLQN
jgi:hypothetical protein